MRFLRVVADSFGPFAGQTLEFAPGMNVIWGPNESGKSAWHAALYAGLCGIRRGRGALRSEDRAFADRHKPWGCDDWKVSAVIALDDGRRIALSHDLEGGVDCRAVDDDTGRDVSAEIMADGAPDGSRWLGLDRKTFPAIACVRQAEVLALTEDPGALQEHLQRAADTAGTDATAAAALARIDEFRKSNVGLDRSGSTRPLRRALEAVERAEVKLRQARQEHEEILGLVGEKESWEEEWDCARRRLRRARTALGERDAERWRARLARAGELAVQFPDGAPPAMRRDDALASDVSASVRLWRERPEVPQLSGRTAAELRAEIAGLPPTPEGELLPAAEVRAAHDRCRTAGQAVELHAHECPAEPVEPEHAGLDAEELRRLAADLETTVPKTDAGLQERFEEAQHRLAQLPSVRARSVGVAGGALLALAAAVALVLGHEVPGFVLLVAGIGMILWAATRAGAAARANALETLRTAENALGEQRHAVEAARKTRRTAEATIAAKNLPAEPAALRALAHQVSDFAEGARALERWCARDKELRAQLAARESQLRRALVAHGVIVERDAVEAFRSYETECAERQRIAVEAGKRTALERQLADREAVERAAEEAQRKREGAETALREVATRCGVAAGDDEGRVAALERWQRQRLERLQEEEKRLSAWSVLQTLLEKRTLEELGERVDRSVAEAERLLQDLDAGDVEEMRRLELEAVDVQELEQQVANAAERVNAAKGRIEEWQRRLYSVPEAEEELAAAETELARIRGLDDTLGLTKKFLEGAEGRVHRDVSRILANSIRPWLPRITIGRYDDVRLDPETLEVQVREAGGDWRIATLLSHGTAEQVYLLVRVALAKHLAKPNEVCPLILDDVTVQCDSRRTAAALDLLHQINKERQVILFSQEDEVLQWAEDRIGPPEDVLQRLGGWNGLSD